MDPLIPHLLRRLGFSLMTAVAIAILSFVVLYARPGEALLVLAEEHQVNTPQQMERLRSTYGLDRPLLVQLTGWLGGLLEGDLGSSWSRPGETVGEVLAENLPWTLALTGSGLLLQLLLGGAVAAVSVLRRGRWPDLVANLTAVTLAALPEFCLGLLLLWPLAIRSGWFPLSGAESAAWERAPGALAVLFDRAHHLVLPALCLGLAGAATVARLLRVRWEEELGARYVVAARARGLPFARIAWKHTLRGAAGPLCTAVGLSLPALIGGAVVVERLFDWPGLGTVLVNAVAARDLPLLAGVNLLLAMLVALGGLLSDLAWAGLDPRARE